MFFNSSFIILFSLDKTMAVKMAGAHGATRWNVYLNMGDDNTPDWRIVTSSAVRDTAIEAFHRIHKSRHSLKENASCI